MAQLAVRSHFYNTTVGKVPWFIKRFGVRELLMRPWRLLFAPRIVHAAKPSSFVFEGEQFQYFYHRYNCTWANERAVELPIIARHLEQHASAHILEVGNVLSHYRPVAHIVVDRYEMGPGVRNEDVMDHQALKPYDLIISISTFEHIGFDDETVEPSGRKILAAIQKCRELLAPAGTLVLTLPVGYNPELDVLLHENTFNSTRMFYLVREGFTSWVQSDKDTALNCRFARPFPYANAIVIAEFSRRDAPPRHVIH